MSHPWLSATKLGVLRSQGADGGNVQEHRLPLSWSLLKEGYRHCVHYQADARWPHFGKVLWCGLALSFIFITRSAEMCADDASKMVHLKSLL